MIVASSQLVAPEDDPPEGTIVRVTEPFPPVTSVEAGTPNAKAVASMPPQLLDIAGENNEFVALSPDGQNDEIFSGLNEESQYRYPSD